MPYQFNLEDVGNWLSYFQKHGYIVLKQVASPDEVASAQALLWNDIGRLNGAFRDYPESWHRLDGQQIGQTGLNSALAQSAGAWLIRSLSRVKHAFALVWAESPDKPDTDLLVSMDVVLLWRPWWIDGTWLPKTEGLHLDQNPNNPPRRSGAHPELDCVQGMVPLLPVTEETGGLEVVPNSHVGDIKEELKSRYPEWQDWEKYGDFCVLGDGDPLKREGGLLLLADPGDLILWDSRTVHGGRVGSHPAAAGGGAAPVTDAAAGVAMPQLARLACTVAMTPQRLVWDAVRRGKEVRGDAVLQQRREHFARGEAMTCYPHRVTTTGQCKSGSLPPSLLLALHPGQRALLGGAPASARQVCQQYASALREERPTAAMALALTDWTAGQWHGAAAVDEVLYAGVEDADGAAVTVRFLSELVDAGTLSARDVGEGLDRLRKLDLDELKLDIPHVERHLAVIVDGLAGLQIA